jgi:hypothetical protein
LIDKGVNAKAMTVVATAAALERSVNNMEPLISGSSVSFQVGSRVRITGLVEAKQHNSKMGTVCNAIEVGTKRLGVDLDEGGTLKIKACNLVALSPTPASFSGSAFSSPASTLSTGALPIPPSYSFC